MWYLQTVEYYSAVKRNETMPFTGAWMDLMFIILSEVSQTEKNKCQIYVIPKEKIDTNELIYKIETDSQS